MLEIAREEGVALPAKNEAGLRKALRCGEIRRSLADYLSAFPVTVSVMRSPRALTRVARELIEDFAAENGKYIEVRFCPLLHVEKGLTSARVVEAVLEGLHDGGSRRGVRWGLILCSLRHFTPRQTEEIALLVKAYRSEGVVAIDMAGDDGLPTLREHLRHLEWVVGHGIGAVSHAAESGSPDDILLALARGIKRIGHGTRAFENQRVVDAMERMGAAVEICLTSNEQTRVVDDLLAHPFPRYLRERGGILTTLNTDNRMLARTTVKREFRVARSLYRLTRGEEVRLTLNAINASFASDDVKDDLRAMLARSA
jgi:adenosine deaminase